MSDTASPAIIPDDVLDPSALEALGIPPFVLDMAKGLGLDLDAMASALASEPDAGATVLDVLERLDDISDRLDRLEPIAAGVERIIAALDSAAPKLRRLGVTWRS